MISDADKAWLQARGFEFEVILEGGMTNLIIRSYQLPVGYSHGAVDLLVRLPAGFPDAAPDMFWVDPRITLASGAEAPASNVYESHVGRQWQRFSRHLAGGAWRPGIDSLESWILTIRHLLERDVPA